MNQIDQLRKLALTLSDTVGQTRSAIQGYLYERTVGELGRMMPFAAAAAAIGSIAIIWAQENLQDMAPTDRARSSAGVLALGLCVIAIVSVLGLLLLKRRCPRVWRQKPEQSGNARLAISFMLSMTIGILLSMGSAYLAVWQNRYHAMEWYRLGFFDKRWFLYLYWTIVSAFLILPPILHRWFLENPLNEFYPGSRPIEDKHKEGVPRKRCAIRATAVKVVLALIVSYLMFGPPWNIQRTSLNINPHEQVHLGPLQAIEKGYLPNIGPAAQQYGPGTQLLTFAFMKLTGQFNLVGFRQAHGCLYLLGYALFAILAFLLLRPRAVLLATVLSLTFSPFALIGWTSDGGLNVWGWPNPLRYAGAVLLLLFMPQLLLSDDETKPNLMATITAGLIWGIFCWIAQENLIVGVIAGGLFALLMWSTRTITGLRILRFAFLTIVGFLIAWLPITTYYIYHGAFVRYLKNYFLVGGQVIRGFSNLPFYPYLLENPIMPITLIFVVPMLILMGVRTLLKGSRAFRPLSMNRARFLALIVVAITCFFGALTRTDLVHLLNTLFVFPIVLTMAYQELPDFGSIRRAKRIRILMLLLLILVALSPVDASHQANYVRGRIRRFFPTESIISQSTITEAWSWQRTGYQILPENASFRIDPAIEVRELLPVLESLHNLTKGQTVFVHSFPYADPGLVYFLADLTPPEIYLDPTSMVWSEDVRREFLTQFKENIERVDYIVTTSIDIPEARMYLAMNPKANVREYTLSNKTVFIVGEQVQ